MQIRFRFLLIAALLPVATLPAKPEIPSIPRIERSDWINVRTDVTPAAKGDGKADDTAALQAALNLFDANLNTPKVVYLPAGVYRITATLEWPSSVACSLIGHGRDTVIKWDAAAKSRMLWSRGGAQSRFDGITWDENGRNTIAVHHNADLRFEASSSHYNSAYLNASAGILGTYGSFQGGPKSNLATSEMVIGMGKSYNYYNELITRCEFRDNGYGIKFGAGYGYVRFCHFENSEQLDIRGSTRSTARFCTSLGSGAFWDVERPVKQPAGVQNCVISGWKNPHSITAHNNSLIFDNVFEKPPGAEAPIYFYDDKAIVSRNVSEKTEGVYNFRSGSEIVDVPAGKLSRISLKATDSFLLTKLKTPTKIFDAVQDFGAGSDKDDTAAVQACIDAAKARGKGAIAYFPSGRYRLSQTIQVSGGDYIIGGTGYHSEFEWKGETGGVMFAVTDPQNLRFEQLGFHQHLMKDGCTAIQHTETGPSSAVYDSMSFPQTTNITSDTARLREGLHLNDLGAESVVYLSGRLNGRARIEDCGRAQIVGEFLNGNHTLVDGADRDTSGFIGWGSMNGHDLTN